MSLKNDVNAASKLMEQLQISLQDCGDNQLDVRCTNDLNTIISVLHNPVLKKIIGINEAIQQLKEKVVSHPSLLPSDFDITEEGEFVHYLDGNAKLRNNLQSPDISGHLRSFDHPYADTQSECSTQNGIAVSSLDSTENRKNLLESTPTTSPTFVIPVETKDNESPPNNGTTIDETDVTEDPYDEDVIKTIQAAAQGREVHRIQLCKQEGTTLGFSVVGLKSEQRGDLGIYVQDIQPNGIAGQDRRLQDGDQILAINGQVLDSFMSHQEAISILQRATNIVDLFIARTPLTQDDSEDQECELRSQENPLVATVIVPPSSESHTSNMLNTEWAQVEVIHLTNDGSGLGFGIIGGRSTGVVVKTILPGGVADREGRLQSGDHILQIGDVNLRGMGSDQVAAVLRQAGTHVRLVVARPVESASPDLQADRNAPIIETRVLNDPDEFERHLTSLTNGYTTSIVIPPPSSSVGSNPQGDPYNNLAYLNGDLEMLAVMNAPYSGSNATSVELTEPPPESPDIPISVSGSFSKSIDSLHVVEGGEGLSVADLPEMENISLAITKDYHGLGITIAGYVCEREELSGIFVKSVTPGSAADRFGQIRVNDQIIEVDGTSLSGLNNHAAVEVLRATGKVVHLKLARYLRGPKFEQLQQAIANSEMKSAPTTPNPTRAVSALQTSQEMSQILGSVESSSPEPERSASAPRIRHESIETPKDFADPVLQSRQNEPSLEHLELLIDKDFVGPLKPSVEAALKTKWARLVDHEYEIIVAQLSKFERGGGLGISLEGTVDVEDGKEVRPHHYIRSILPDGPVGRNQVLCRGDELLEVNNQKLLGLNHVEVVTILKELPANVRIVCGRKSLSTSREEQATPDEDTVKNILGGSLQNLSPLSERLVKAKSDGSLASAATASDNISLSKIKSRSLEPLSGLAMWSEEPQEIDLVKGERGLGFSILDYQDPLNLQDTVIVIRSLVPGGVAEKDGRLIPGDRLISVNGIELENASLDAAVAALKGAPKGIVRICVTKPVGVLESPGQLDAILRESNGSDEYEELMKMGDQMNIDQMESDEIIGGLPEVSHWRASEAERTQSTSTLPKHLVRTIIISRRMEPLGIDIKTVEPPQNGVIISSVAKGGAAHLDGRLKVGDFILSINDEPARNYNASQIKKLQHIDSDIKISYISGQEASDFRRSLLVSHRTETFSEGPNESLNASFDTADLSRSSSNRRIDQSVSRGKLDSDLRPEDEKPFTIVFRNLSEAPKSTQSREPQKIDDETPPLRLHQRQVSEDMQLENTTGMDGRHWGPERTVEVKRDEKGSLGISIVGGKVDLSWSGSSVTGIFVKNVLQMSPAGRSGLLKTGDRILEVEGIDLRNAVHEKAVEVIKNTGNPVTFVVQSLVQWSSSDSLPVSRDSSRLGLHAPEPVSQARTPSPELIQPGLSDEKKQIFQEQIKAASVRRQSTELLTDDNEPSESSDDEDEDSRQLQGKVSLPSGQEIDRNSAGALPATKEENENNEEDMYGYTERKVKRKYGKLEGEVFVVDLQKDENGLGLTIAGHKDRTQMGSYICGLNPSGQAYKDGRIEIGDEILEVNGQVVQGMSHLNVSKISKQCSGSTFKIIIRRLPSDAESQMAVKKVTHFPVNFQEESPEERYSHFKGLTKFTMNKGQGGLGIMIIEGKHAEYGRGIFVSDLQEESTAAKAGLMVGDMILSVNNEEMIGMSYDNATAIVRALEGVITVWAANPARAKETPKKEAPKDTAEEAPKKPALLPKPPIATKPTTIRPPLQRPPVPPIKPIRHSKLPVEMTATEGVSKSTTPEPSSVAIKYGKEIPIEVTKGKRGLGLSIVGGSDTMLGAIIVHEVYEEGAAWNDGRLQPGDQLLEVNNEDFRSITHQKALNVLRQTPSKVKMVVFRPDTSKEEEMYETSVIQLIKKSGKGLGLSIVGRIHGPGVFVSDLVRGGVAECDGRLMQGDQIFEVNEHDLRKATQEQAAALLKCSPTIVTLKVGRLKPGKIGSSRTNVDTLPLQVDTYQPLGGANYHSPIGLLDPHIIDKSTKEVEPPLEKASSEDASSMQLIPREVILNRGDDGLGFSIVGGYGSNLGDLPIYVKSVFDRGAAAIEGTLCRGDQVMKVNGQPLIGMNHAEAVAVLKEARGTVVLTVLSSK